MPARLAGFSRAGAFRGDFALFSRGRAAKRGKSGAFPRLACAIAHQDIPTDMLVRAAAVDPPKVRP
jgi:hypothetical protein